MDKKILLIDDEKDLTELVQALLQFENFNVNFCNQPLVAKELIKKEPFDAIIADIMMPDLDGLSLIRDFLSSNPDSKIKIFILSGKKLSDVERKYLLDNKIHFIPKPFDPVRLVELVKNTVA